MRREEHCLPSAGLGRPHLLGDGRQEDAPPLIRLIEEARRTPFEGTGKPEPLRHNLSGLWSRRIDDEHRLVYGATDEELIIIQARYHYDDQATRSLWPGGRRRCQRDHSGGQLRGQNAARECQRAQVSARESRCQGWSELIWALQGRSGGPW